MFKSGQDTCNVQHAFPLMADEAGGSIVLASLEISFKGL